MLNQYIFRSRYRYRFNKDLDKKWLQVGFAFRRFLQDVIRVWPGPGCPGLSLLQLGVSTSINDITEPYLPIPASPAVTLSDEETHSDDDICRLAKTYFAIM